MATKIAHADVCYVMKERSIKIHIPDKDGDVRQCAGRLAVSLSITTHIIHKSHRNYEYIAVEYRKPSVVNSQCVLRI